MFVMLGKRNKINKSVWCDCVINNVSGIMMTCLQFERFISSVVVVVIFVTFWVRLLMAYTVHTGNQDNASETIFKEIWKTF